MADRCRIRDPDWTATAGQESALQGGRGVSPRQRCGDESDIGDTRANMDTGLYLLAFGPLRPVFTARELAGFVDRMSERGLRIRRGLEEYGWKEEEQEGEGEEDAVLG